MCRLKVNSDQVKIVDMQGVYIHSGGKRYRGIYTRKCDLKLNIYADDGTLQIKPD